MKELITERYDGVISLWCDPEEAGILSTSTTLKRLFDALPDHLDGGANVKVGLTSAGYAVYRCVVNGRLGYYKIVLRGRDGEPTLGTHSYRPIGVGEHIHVPREPHEGFGDRWTIKPEQDSRPPLQKQYDAKMGG